MSKLYLGSKELTAFNIGDKEVQSMYLGSTQVYQHNTIVYSYITLDQTISDPAKMISGDINGEAVQLIRQNSHRVIGKYTAERTVTYCRLDDNNSTKYHDGTKAVLDGTQGDVFMKLPQFFWKVTTESTNVFKIGLAYGGKPDNTWKEWDGNALIGVYEGYITSNKLYSVSSKTPTTSISQRLHKSYARNRGTGFRIVDWSTHCIMAMLYYCQYGNTDIQTNLGAGTNSSAKTTGFTDSLGMADTVARINGNINGINFWGVENWYGDLSEWIDNVEVDVRTWSVVELDGTKRLIGVGTPYNGYINKLKLGEFFDMVPIDTITDNVGYCDYYIQSSSSNRVVERSYSNNHSSGGIAYIGASSDENVYSSAACSRLTFRGDLIEAGSVEEFKNISAIS